MDDVLAVKLYCMKCGQAVNGNHECQEKHVVLFDSNLEGIVDRLYALGIIPRSAIYYFHREADEDRLRITVYLLMRLTYELLGKLPDGWEYCWQKGEVHALEFNDWLSCPEEKDREARVPAVIKGFEAFLDGLDTNLTKAFALLTGHPWVRLD